MCGAWESTRNEAFSVGLRGVYAWGMKNPNTDPLPDVESYLIATIGGPWALAVSVLNEWVRKPQPEDKHHPAEIQEAIQQTRERSYEQTIRALARQRLTELAPLARPASER